MKIMLFCLAAMLLAATGCANTGAVRPDSPAQDNETPSLDVPDEWADPEDNYTQARDPAMSARPRDPTQNPLATPIAIVGGTVLTAAGKRFEKGTILVDGGRIEYVGAGAVSIPDEAGVIDATGKFVTPGIIDTHSHIGVYASPGATAHNDGNEMTAPVTAELRAAYGFWPQDPAITRALAGGVTSAQILPGSANLIGGRGFSVVMRPGRTTDEVRFPGAPPTLKMACGENPKRTHGEKGGPATRMGVYTAFRAAFHQAREYNAQLAAYQRKRALWLRKRDRAAEFDKQAAAAGKNARIKPEPAPEPPPRNLQLDTLAAVLRGEVLVQVHCYRAADLFEMVRIADEFGFAIRSFHHALDAYKVRDILIDHGIAISTWADWWGFKMEAFDGIPHNAALFAESGGRAVIHSDSSIGIQRLNQEAAKAMYAGRHAGIEIGEDEALRWITANAAWVLGIHEVTGTLEKGKRADVVIWNHHPFSVYASADMVIQGGEIAYERNTGKAPTDFEVGNRAPVHEHGLGRSAMQQTSSPRGAR